MFTLLTFRVFGVVFTISSDFRAHAHQTFTKGRSLYGKRLTPKHQDMTQNKTVKLKGSVS